MATKRFTIQHRELIELFAEKFNVRYNDACDEIGDSDFIGECTLHHAIEMVEDGYNNRAWVFIRDFMLDRGLNNVVVLS